MILTIERNVFVPEKRTFSRFYSDSADWKFDIIVLEDADRGLHNLMAPKTILKHKIKGATAIPYTTDVIYEMAHTWSNRFKKVMPLVMNVPGYDGIRVHNGKTEDSTEGCPCVGTKIIGNYAGLDMKDSTETFKEWHIKFAENISKSKIYLRVIKTLAPQIIQL